MLCGFLQGLHTRCPPPAASTLGIRLAPHTIHTIHDLSYKSDVAANGRKGVQTHKDEESIEADSASLNHTQTSPERTKVDDRRLRIVVEKNGKLESKVSGLRKVVEGLKDSLKIVIKEKDILQSQIKMQARQRAIEEAELRVKLKAAHLRIEQLELESICLGAA